MSNHCLLLQCRFECNEMVPFYTLCEITVDKCLFNLKSLHDDETTLIGDEVHIQTIHVSCTTCHLPENVTLNSTAINGVDTHTHTHELDGETNSAWDYLWQLLWISYCQDRNVDRLVKMVFHEFVSHVHVNGRQLWTQHALPRNIATEMPWTCENVCALPHAHTFTNLSSPLSLTIVLFEICHCDDTHTHMNGRIRMCARVDALTPVGRQWTKL